MHLKGKAPGINLLSSSEQAKVLFDLDAITGSTFEWNSANAGGKPTITGDTLTATATYTGLPVNNDAFGLRKARIEIDSVIAAENEFEVFFPRDATNHPDGQAGSPNWFYYWSQLVVPNTNLYYGGPSIGSLDAVVPAMVYWSYVTAHDKTQIRMYDGAILRNRAYGVGNEYSGIDAFQSIVLHESVHVQQIARADALVPTGQVGSPWMNGWSFNQPDHNHWELGPDDQSGAASVDDDNDGHTDNLKVDGKGELGSGDDIDLTHPDSFSISWPAAWPLPSPMLFPLSEIESEAINVGNTWVENQSAREDWGNPGKNHQTFDNYEDKTHPTNVKTLLILFATLAPSMASVSVPPPDAALKKASFVASGKVETREDGVFLVPIEVLKIAPDQKPKKEYKVADILFTEWYYASYTARIAKSDTILFVGGFDSKTGSIRPIFSMSSVWPNGTIPEYLKIRTFDECLSFAKEALGNEEKFSEK